MGTVGVRCRPSQLRVSTAADKQVCQDLCRGHQFSTNERFSITEQYDFKLVAIPKLPCYSTSFAHAPFCCAVGRRARKLPKHQAKLLNNITLFHFHNTCTRATQYQCIIDVLEHTFITRIAYPHRGIKPMRKLFVCKVDDLSNIARSFNYYTRLCFHVVLHT